jgi:hypothetical protein
MFLAIIGAIFRWPSLADHRPNPRWKFPFMRFTRELSAFGWTIGASFSPGWLTVGFAWEASPPGFFVAAPLAHFWIERSETDHDKEPWCWDGRWSGWRSGKSNSGLTWTLTTLPSVSCPALDHFAIDVGPLNVQIETNKMYDVDFPPGIPTLRVFFPPGASVTSWPPRCRCCPPRDQLQCDDVTDLADGQMWWRHNPSVRAEDGADVQADRTRYRPLAEAALKPLAKPTEIMIDAAHEAVWSDNFWAINSRRDFKKAVRAMILAAAKDDDGKSR